MYYCIGFISINRECKTNIIKKNSKISEKTQKTAGFSPAVQIIAFEEVRNFELFVVVVVIHLADF